MHDDLLKFRHRVDQRATALYEDIKKDLEAVLEKVMGKMAALEADHPARGRRFLEKQKTEIEKVLRETYATIENRVREAGDDVANASAKHTYDLTTSSLQIKGAYGLSFDYVEKWFESQTVDGLMINEWIGKLERGSADKLTSLIRRAMIEGMNSRNAVWMLRREGIEGSIPNLERLARTSMATAANYANEMITLQEFGDDLTGFTYSATLDNRTCLRCGPLDGTYYSKDDSRPMLPLHWGCRCMYIPEFKRVSREITPRPGTKWEEPRTIHHRDGSTSTTWGNVRSEHFTGTYNQWLRNQLPKDHDFVKSILGSKRFELFQSGKLKLNQMSTTGRIKNISELTK